MKQLSQILCIGVALLGAATAAKAGGLPTNNQSPPPPPPPAPQNPELLTFDELPSSGPLYNGTIVPNGYGGLNWDNFGVINGLSIAPEYGYHAAVVSPKNVAFNMTGTAASISDSHGTFDLDSAYLTFALNLDSLLNIQVEGFRGGTLVYDNTYVENRHAAGFVDFNYLGVDQVTFITSPQQQFAMDNLLVTIPEPGTCALLCVAAAMGGLAVRRRRS